MLIDKPCCDFQKCKHHFDGNCMNKIEYGRCPYNRQKAEIERLKTQLHLEKYTDVAKRNIETEAIKRFAERLKEKGTPVTGGKGFEGVFVMCSNLVIDNLVKEMTEVNENG